MPTSGENSQKPLIVFFGTGPVAAESLRILTKWFEIEAVVTKPKPAHHRGSVPVLELADKLHLPVVTATDKQQLSEKITNEAFESTVAVLIDFGIIVTQDVIDAFPLGIINSHFSLLPEWRGADPISFAILSGQKKTGVSLMHLVEKMDEGPILGVGIHEDIDQLTTPELTDKLIQLSAGLLRDLLPKYISGEMHRGQEQSVLHNLIPGYPETPTYSRKLTKEDGVLDFAKPAKQLECEVRAYAEWPKSRTTITGKDVVVLESHVANEEEVALLQQREIGQIYANGKKLAVQTADGVLVFDLVKPAGKSAMTAQAFLAGYGKDLS